MAFSWRHYPKKIWIYQYENEIENCIPEITSSSPRDQWVKYPFYTNECSPTIYPWDPFHELFFSIVIKIRWKSHFAVVTSMAIKSLQNFAHTTMACVKYCSDHIVRVEVKRNEISIEFESRRKKNGHGMSPRSMSQLFISQPPIHRNQCWACNTPGVLIGSKSCDSWWIPISPLVRMPLGGQFQSSVLGMMMSSNGNIFHVTGPLCGEFTGDQCIPLTKASDAELWCFLLSAPK